MNLTKIRKAIDLVLAEANELDKEAIASMKDNNIGKVYINIKTMQKAMTMIEKAVTTDIKKRKEVVVKDAEKKIVVDEEKNLKIKKLTKKELAELEKPAVKKAPAKKTVQKEEVVSKAPKKRGRKPSNK